MNNVIIILNYNDYDSCNELIQYIQDYEALSRIVIVDNFSSDDSYEKLKKFRNEKITVIRSDRNGGYAYGNNFGVLYAISHFQGIQNIIISNPDVFFLEETIQEMESAFETDPDISAVGCVVRTAQGDVDPCFAWNRFDYDFTMRPYLKLYGAIQSRARKKHLLYPVAYLNDGRFVDVGTVHGCFFMVKLEDFIKAGLFDERTFLYCEEDILSYRLMRIGKKECVATQANVIHKGSCTIKKNVKNSDTTRKYSYESRLLYLVDYLRLSKPKIWLYKLLAKP